MKRSAAFFTIALAFGAMMLAPGLAGADAQKEGPIEIERCQTISQPGSYKLVHNLTAAQGADCLPITANDVTIDLAGFSISSSTPPGGTAIGGPLQGPLATGVTVRNGSIVGFGLGVNLGDDSLVEGLHVVGGCGRPCALGISATGIVKGNTVSDLLTGMQASGVITGNYVFGNGTVGIGVGEGSTVIGNTSNQNTIAGFTVSCPSNVTNNTAVNNGTNLVLNGTGCNNTNNVAP